jgi:hypothetical protein
MMRPKWRQDVCKDKVFLKIDGSFDGSLGNMFGKMARER